MGECNTILSVYALYHGTMDHRYVLSFCQSMFQFVVDNSL